jgi:hypothetical protein
MTDNKTCVLRLESGEGYVIGEQPRAVTIDETDPSQPRIHLRLFQAGSDPHAVDGPAGSAWQALRAVQDGSVEWLVVKRKETYAVALRASSITRIETTLHRSGQ